MVSRESIGIIQDKALRFCSTLHHSCPFNEFIALWIELLALGMLSKYSNTNLHPLPITFRLRVLIWFLWSGHLEEIADKPILYNSPIVYYKHNQKISLNYFLSLHMFKLLIFFSCCEFHTCSLKRKRTERKRFANPHCCGVPYVTLAPRLTSLLAWRLSVSFSFATTSTAFTPRSCGSRLGTVIWKTCLTILNCINYYFSILFPDKQTMLETGGVSQVVIYLSSLCKAWVQSPGHKQQQTELNILSHSPRVLSLLKLFLTHSPLSPKKCLRDSEYLDV